MAFDALTGWFVNRTVHAGGKPSSPQVTASAGVFSVKDADQLAALLQEIIDALDYIAEN